MKVLLEDKTGQTVDVLDSRDLTQLEWDAVRKHPRGVLALRDLPDGKRDASV